MGKGPARNIRVYLDQFDISGALTASQASLAQETPVVTTFADSGPRRLVGQYDHEHAEMGLFDGADNEFDEQLWALLGDQADHYLTKCWQGLTRGNIAYDYPVRVTGEPRQAARGGAVLLGFESAGAGGLSRGVVLHGGSITAGNQPGVNQGATIAGQLYRVLFRLLSFTGTSITLKLQESQNDGNPDAYADIAGLSSGALSAPGVVPVQTLAATEAWKRVVATGTFSAAVVLVTAGVVAP